MFGKVSNKDCLFLQYFVLMAFAYTTNVFVWSYSSIYDIFTEIRCWENLLSIIKIRYLLCFDWQQTNR